MLTIYAYRTREGIALEALRGPAKNTSSERIGAVVAAPAITPLAAHIEGVAKPEYRFLLPDAIAVIIAHALKADPDDPRVEYLAETLADDLDRFVRIPAKVNIPEAEDIAAACSALVAHLPNARDLCRTLSHDPDVVRSLTEIANHAD